MALQKRLMAQPDDFTFARKDRKRITGGSVHHHELD
jgi:hypothetical protein